ncbi:uncharacterized protein F5Z01DRAFT_266838 [Emericellopsis atlantica]|uniref:NAD-dependent epimerase/dehydratase domain-containing protein n=1 Tax=Emericellopsis atlantica TaxID=2614577 RepID=A0A9P7ZH95_9HYPO|nr:uncharacterized protein F5Z01DRAFT_266838 [Emericellopsis atlantica]KAG9251797.1 hypothetical protein F5Z01DRAFT_266838 [Emericellopsis atlantica]
MTSHQSNRKTVLVTGANGYIGFSVSRAFVRAGYRVFGLVRRVEATIDLQVNEITPVVGTLDDLAWVPNLFEKSNTFNVLVNCLESYPDYEMVYQKLITLFRQVAMKSNENGVRPLLMWSSGCKDYGMDGAFHGDPNFVAQTEESPIDGTAGAMRSRAETSLRVFDHPEVFDGIVLRPTCVYGYSSSYYGALLDYASEQADKGEPALRIPVDPRTPMHACHVDDCAEAYISLAEHAPRTAVANQVYNISAHRYETVGEIGGALAAAYGFPDGATFPQDGGDWFPSRLYVMFNFPQWVGSDKIRKVTGWTDKRALFQEDIGVFRAAYEAEKARGHENIAKSSQRLHGIGSLVQPQ